MAWVKLRRTVVYDESCRVQLLLQELRSIHSLPSTLRTSRASLYQAIVPPKHVLTELAQELPSVLFEDTEQSCKGLLRDLDESDSVSGGGRSSGVIRVDLHALPEAVLVAGGG